MYLTVHQLPGSDLKSVFETSRTVLILEFLSPRPVIMKY